MSHASFMENAGGNLVAIRSTNYLRHSSKMVSSDELSIVNTSVRASATHRVYFCSGAKAAEKGA